MEDNLLHIPGFDVGSFIHALENWKKKGSQMSDDEEVQHDLSRIQSDTVESTDDETDPRDSYNNSLCKL